MTQTEFEAHTLRGPANAAFFSLAGGFLDRKLRSAKSRYFTNLTGRVVELGSGVGANLPYLQPGTTLVAVEPNPAMHGRLRQAAQRHGVVLDLHSTPAERVDLPDQSVDVVISSLVLCTVSDPAAVLAEVRRILRPGGRFVFAEHVAAENARLTRIVQRAFRRPWAWCFEGCSCERDLAAAIRGAGFAQVLIERYRLRSVLPMFNPQIAGVAVA